MDKNIQRLINHFKKAKRNEKWEIAEEICNLYRKLYPVRTDMDEDITWITVKGTHIPLNENGTATGGPLEGKNFSGTQSENTSKAGNEKANKSNNKTMSKQYKEFPAMNEYDFYTEEQENFRFESIKELAGYDDNDAQEALEALCGTRADYLRLANSGYLSSPKCWFTGGNRDIRNMVDDECKKKAEVIDRYIENSPKYEGEMYRGISLEDIVLDEFKIGDTFEETGAISSWSTTASVAETFAQGGEGFPCVLISSNPRHGTPAAHLSIYGADEDEIMVSNMEEKEYIIDNIEIKDGTYYLTISQKNKRM